MNKKYQGRIQNNVFSRIRLKRARPLEPWLICHEDVTGKLKTCVF